MHYYQHHIGDFLKDTNFLTNEEIGIYLKLIWLYYDSEKPLPNDIFSLSMKTNSRENENAVKGILEMFFEFIDGFWHHTRCDKEIQEYQVLIENKSKAGKLSAEKKAKKISTGVEQVLNTSGTHEQLTINHKPITNNHINTVDKSTVVKTKVLPTVPYQEIIDLYNSTLPELQKVEILSEARKRSLKTFWSSLIVRYNTGDKNETLTLLKQFFEHIRESDFLMGRIEEKNGRKWRPNLDWIIQERNFVNILERKYHK